MISLRIISPDDWQSWRELRLEALREAPYAYGSTLAQWQGLGDTEQRWRNRLTTVHFNVIATLDGTPAGIVSGTYADIEANVELISMWVAPFARGRGVGDALVDAVIQWSRTQRADHVVLAVVPRNARAIALYERHGFTHDGMMDGELRMLRSLPK